MAQPDINGPSSGPPGGEPERPPSRLVLASEALKEDLAPSRPGAHVGRILIGALSVSLALLGISLRTGTGPGSGVDPASLAFTAAAATAAVAALPFTYEVRAGAVAMLGLGLMVLGSLGLGPAASASEGGLHSAARFAGVGVLPAALLFRARYRAYPKARVVLAMALLIALPFVVTRGLAATDPALASLERASALGTAACALASLFGFMGYYTTGGSAVWAAVLLCVGSADVAMQDIMKNYPWLPAIAGAVGTACAATLMTLGVYHLLSRCLSADARNQTATREPPTLA